jgi:hypothetical protein
MASAMPQALSLLFCHHEVVAATEGSAFRNLLRNGVILSARPSLPLRLFADQASGQLKRPAVHISSSPAMRNGRRKPTVSEPVAKVAEQNARGT